MADRAGGGVRVAARVSAVPRYIRAGVRGRPTMVDHAESARGTAVMAGRDREVERIRAAYGRRADGDRRYSWFSPGHLFLIHQRERAMLRTLSRLGWTDLRQKRMLDLGCGDGYWLREFLKWGVPPDGAVGLDVVGGRVRRARAQSPAGVQYVM